MAEKKQPPGIMFYPELLPIFEEMPPEEVKEVIVAALQYGTGIKPDAPSGNTSKIVWTLLKPRIDANKEKYIETCNHRAYGKYEKDMKEKGKDPLPYEEWIERRQET